MMKIFDASNTNIHALKTLRMSVLLFLLMIVVGQCLWYFKKGFFFWEFFSIFVMNISVLAFTFYRKNLSLKLINILFASTLIISLLAHSLVNYKIAVLNINFSYFTPFKVAPLLIAILTTSKKLGVYLIIFTSFFPVFLLAFIFPPNIWDLIPIFGAWVYPIFGFIGLFVMHHKFNSIELEKNIIRLNSQKIAADNLAKIFLAFKDFTNTPLQNIELASYLLKNKKIDAQEAVKYIDRSLEQFHSLKETMEEFENEVDWDVNTAGFNSIDSIRKIIRSTSIKNKK